MKKIVLIVSLLVGFSICNEVKAMLSNSQFDMHEIKQVKSDTLPVKQSSSNSAKTVKTLHKNDVIIVYPVVTSGWVRTEGGYVNNGMLTAPIAYGMTYTRKPIIQKLKADVTIKDRTGKVIHNFQKGDLVQERHDASAKISQGLSLKQPAGYIEERYLEDVPPTIRSANGKGGIVLREKPSPSAKIIATIPQKMAVKSYGQVAGGWRVVTYGHTVGYVPASVMEARKPATRFVLAEGLPVYEKASRNAAVTLVLEQGTQVQVYDGTAGWSYIYSDAIEGYVPTQFLATKKPTVTNKSNASTLKMDARAIKPHITKTTTMTQSNGSNISIHLVGNRVGMQQAGSNVVHFQGNMGTNDVNATAERLTRDTGTFFIGCSRQALCQYVNGQFIETIGMNGPFNMSTRVYMKSFAKGKVQIAYEDIDFDYEAIVFITYSFHLKQQQFQYVQTHYYSPSQNWQQGKENFERWQEEPSFIVQ